MLQGIDIDNKDQLDLRAIQSVRKAIHWVPATLETWIIHLAEELVKPGQHKNLISIAITTWESTTTAGTLTAIQKVSIATLLIPTYSGNTALFHSVSQHMIVKGAIHLESRI